MLWSLVEVTCGVVESVSRWGVVWGIPDAEWGRNVWCGVHCKSNSNTLTNWTVY